MGLVDVEDIEWGATGECEFNGDKDAVHAGVFHELREGPEIIAENNGHAISVVGGYIAVHGEV